MGLCDGVVLVCQEIRNSSRLGWLYQPNKENKKIKNKRRKNMKKILLAVLTLASALGFSMPVYALTQTSTMPVSMTVVPSVNVSATSLNFGSIAPSAGSDANATISVTAANGTAYTVTLDAGLNYDGSSRIVKSGATTGGYYYLYTDMGANEWGDSGFGNTYNGMGSAPGVTGTGSGAIQNLTVYGQLGAFSTGGTFTDTVTVTVNY